MDNETTEDIMECDSGEEDVIDEDKMNRLRLIDEMDPAVTKPIPNMHQRKRRDQRSIQKRRSIPLLKMPSWLDFYCSNSPFKWPPGRHLKAKDFMKEMLGEEMFAKLIAVGSDRPLEAICKKISMQYNKKNLLPALHNGVMKSVAATATATAAAAAAEKSNSPITFEHYRLYINRVFRTIFPNELIDEYNFKIVIHSIAVNIFNLRNRQDISFQKFYGQALRYSKVKWLKSIHSSCDRCVMFRSIVTWLLRFAVSITKLTFYVTNESSSNSLRFYCKDVWRRIEDESFQRYQSSLMLQPYPERLKPNEVKNVLRFMPKGDATRPITRSIRTSAKDRVFARVATQLKETNGLLDYICRSALASKSRVPLTGAGIRGGNFCKPFKKFATRYWKGERPKIYVVKSDIRECFDSINHNKLREVLRSMINENRIYRYETSDWKSRRIRRPKSQRKIEKQRRKLANARKALIRRLLSPTQRNDAIEELYHRRMIQFLEIMKSPDIVDQVVLSGAEAMRIINNAVIDQKFFFRNRCYTRGRGIPQGNPLSTRLSNLYLGAMERERYPDILRRRDCLFLRYADDYLLLTADIDVANRFLKDILCVQQDSDRDVYGIKGALNKTTINFDADLSDDLKSQISVIDEHGCVRWCGYEIYPTELKISIDLSKIEKYRAFKRFWNGSVVGSHKKRLDILNYIRGPVLRKMRVLRSAAVDSQKRISAMRNLARCAYLAYARPYAGSLMLNMRSRRNRTFMRQIPRWIMRGFTHSLKMDPVYKLFDK